MPDPTPMEAFLAFITQLITSAMSWFSSVAEMIIETPVLAFGIGIMVLGLILRLVYSAIRRGTNT